MIFETIEVFVSFPAIVASIGLMLFHAESPWVNLQSFRINNGKRAILISSKLLCIVAVLAHISKKGLDT